MSTEDKKTMIAEAYVGRTDAMRKLNDVRAALLGIKHKLLPLLERLPELSSDKFHMEVSTLPAGMDLSQIEKLLEETETLERQIAGYNKQFELWGL